MLSFLPALFILGYRVLDMVLIIYGFRQNRYMDGTVGRKTTAQIPDEDGNFGDKPSNATVVVLLLGLRTNQYVWSDRLVHLKRWRDIYMTILFTKFGVFLVYTRARMLTYGGCFSPLGIFYPGFQKINSYFVDMMKDLESNREDYGCEFCFPFYLLLHLQTNPLTTRGPV